MEWLEGEILRDRLTRGAFEPRALADLARQTAQALLTAHSKGITHRDLKPDNIYLVDQKQVKVLDFGIARQAFLSGESLHPATDWTPSDRPAGRYAGLYGTGTSAW